MSNRLPAGGYEFDVPVERRTLSPEIVGRVASAAENAGLLVLANFLRTLLPRVSTSQQITKTS